MATNATMMIHYARGVVMGTPKHMKSYVEMLDKVSQATCQNIATAMGEDFDTVFQKFFADEADHFLTYAETKAHNLLTEDDTPQYEAVALSNKVYDMQKSLIDKLNAQVVQLSNEVITITEKTEESEMNADALKSAIAEGKITLAEAEAIIAEEKAKQPLSNEVIMAMVNDAIAPLKAENTALQAKIVALESRTTGAAPATAEATAEAANDPDATQKSEAEMAFEKRNAEYIRQVQTGQV